MNTSNLVEIMVLIYGIGIFIYLVVRSFSMMKSKRDKERQAYYQNLSLPYQTPPQYATKGKIPPNFNNLGQNPQLEAVRQIASNDNLSVYDRIAQIKKVLGIK